MTPFQEFRLWARRAPGNERLAAATATAVVLALLVWVLIPSSSTGANSAYPGTSTSDTTDGTTTTTTSGGGHAGGSTSGTTDGGSVTTGPGTTSTGSTGTDTGTGTAPTATDNGTLGSDSGTTTTQSDSGECQSPQASGPGVDDNTIKIAVMLTQIIGPVGNAAFNVADPSLQQNAYDAAIEDLNANGGAGCRKIVAQYFKSNPADQQSLGAQCNDIANGDYFAVLDSGAFSSTGTAYKCFPQHHIAYFSAYLMQESLRREFYPYVLGFNTYDAIYHDSVYGLKQQGFFSAQNGFKKLGILERSCFPEEITYTKKWLNEVGVSDSEISEFSVGCPAILASDSDLQQAVLQFKREGVTHVTYVAETGDFAQFTNDADTQNAHWKYGLPNDQLVTVSYGNRHPNYHQMIGSVSVSQDRDGEETTPGYKPTAATKRCDAILAKHNIDPTYKQPYAVGNACDQIWMLAASINHAPAIQPDALAAGLQASKTIDFSFPQGPNDFTKEGTTTGGQFYRYDGWKDACKCWQVTEPTFRRSTY